MKKIFAAICVLTAAFSALHAYAAPEAAVHYTMDSAESAGQCTGIQFEEGIIDKAAVLSDSAYISLPDDVVSSMTDFTISTWVKPSETADWARIFDFGTGTAKYMFLAPRNNAGQTVFAITSSNSGSEQKITSECVFTPNNWTHICIAKKGNTGIMYADGIEVGRNESMTLSPKDIGSTNKNYIGKSQYSSDPYFNGAIDDFRIYSEALSAEDIKELAGEINKDIISIEDTEVSISAGSELKPPNFVSALFSDGTKRDVRVDWESFDSNLLKQDGKFEILGNIAGTSLKAKTTVTVTSLSVKTGLTITGNIYSNNSKVTADYNIYNIKEASPAVIYFAAYADGKLAGVSMQKIDSLSTGSYSITLDAPKGDSILMKSFLWNSDMTPLAQPLSKEFGNPYGSSFEVGEVKLLEGKFKESQDLGKEYLLSLDVDRLLAPVAYAAGAITDTSCFYGGWEQFNYRGYGAKGIAGHSVGHWMSAVSTMYSVTGDETLKEKLDYTVSKLDQYQQMNGNGYVGGFEKTGFENALSGTLKVSAFDLNGYWVPWYSIHKIYQGLIDAYELTGNNQALDVVLKFADWAKNLTDPMDDDKFNLMLTCEYGGMNEVMSELYSITGNKDYLDLAVRFSQPAILNPLSEGKDELQGKHANTQIPKVIGAADVFENDSDRTDYRNAARFFYDTVVNHRSYSIGGNSNYEHFGSIKEEVLGTQTCETCNTYNMLKLTEHLYAWNHDASYMDYYEKALYNHILASQDPNSGMKTYFMSTKQGHFKVYSTPENSFWCCVGSGMENPGRYTRNIYYKDGDNFYVNLFIPSEVEWTEKSMKLSQKTNYPYEQTTQITIDEGSGYADIHIRIPEWIDSAAIITVNGETPLEISQPGYAVLSRNWNKGDTINVTLPMGLHTYTARDSENKVSFMYGPIVLAGALGTDNFPSSDIVSDHTSLDNQKGIEVPDLIVDDKDPNSFITLVDKQTLTFKTSAASASNGSEITLIPYCDLHHQRYSLYWMLYGKDEVIDKDEFTKALENATIDVVRPNEQQPEVDHNMKTYLSNSGYFDAAERGWRDARGEGAYFSYDMKVNPDAENNYVMALYWGSDAPFKADSVSYTRDFSIYADDVKLGAQILNNNDPNQLIYMYYAIPKELTSGKDKVTVKFESNGKGKAAGGVFEVRTTTAEIKK